MGTLTTIGIGIVAFIIGVFIGRRTAPSVGFAAQTEEERVVVTAEAHRAISDRIAKRKARILERARAAGHITNDGVEDLFCISDTTARRYLGALEAEGHLTQEGVGRGTRYLPTVES